MAVPVIPVIPDDLYLIIIKLLTVLGLPVIVALVYRDDETLFRAFHVFGESAF